MKKSRLIKAKKNRDVMFITQILKISLKNHIFKTLLAYSYCNLCYQSYSMCSVVLHVGFLRKAVTTFF